MQSALAEASITMPVAQAREKVAEYLKSVRERHNDEDAAILQGYKALAKGHTHHRPREGHQTRWHLRGRPNCRTAASCSGDVIA